MASIYDLSWARTWFIAKLILFFRANLKQRRKIKSVDIATKAAGYSALSSTYYSIAGTAGAQCKAIQKQAWGFVWVPLFLMTWISLGGWCWWRMLYLSDRVVELIGYEGMTAAQCDTRQSILRSRARFFEARTCIDFGLRKDPIDAHTRGLLYCGYAETFGRQGDQHTMKRYVLLALDAAKEAERTDPRQAGRIYKQCAPLADWIRMASPFITGAELLRIAEVLACQTGATDQILKIGD